MVEPMFDLETLLSPRHILPRVKARCQRDGFRRIAEAMADEVGATPEEILEALLERERLGSTALGDGVAVPHARLPDLDRMVGGLVQLDPALDFEAVDGKPVDLAFVLLAPEAAGSEHLRALAKVARIFRDKALVASLRAADNADAMQAVLVEHQASHAA